MNIKGRRNRKSVELIVIVRVGKRSERVVSVKGTVKSLTTLVTTAKVDSRMFRPEWSAVMQIVLGSLLGHK